MELKRLGLIDRVPRLAVINASGADTLYELFELHASARGSLVESIDDADTIFSIETGITPFDIGLINSEFIN